MFIQRLIDPFLLRTSLSIRSHSYVLGNIGTGGTGFGGGTDFGP